MLVPMEKAHIPKGVKWERNPPEGFSLPFIIQSLPNYY